MTEEEVRELLYASEDGTSDEHDMSSNDDREYDKLLHKLVVNPHSHKEENEDDSVANGFRVKSRDESEYWSNVPTASNRGSITAKNFVVKSHD